MMSLVTRSQRLLIRLSPTMAAVLLILGEGPISADPPALTLEGLRQGDPANLPAYTLRVKLEQPAGGLIGQGVGRYVCVLTRGKPGFAGLCEAEELPKPVYFPPGTPSYRSDDYDSEGNLGLWVRAKNAILLTTTVNDDYDEGRTFGVNPQGVVVDTGVTRRIDRYAPDDLWGGGLSNLRRVWWALGQGLSGDFERIGSTSEAEGLQRVEIHSKSEGRWPGVWHTAFDTEQSSLIRQASFISDARSDVSVEVTSKGARQFGPLTLAEEGIVRFPSLRYPMETRVFLQNFEPRFDEELFRQVQKTLQRVLTEGNLLILDYRMDRTRPVTSRPAPPEGARPADD